MIYSLDMLLSWFGTSLLFHVLFCCFLTCIQVSQEAGKVVWYSHLFKNFLQFLVIHTVKGFDAINKAEVDVFLEFSYFFDDPTDVGNLISGSSAFSKSSFNIRKFSVHTLLNWLGEFWALRYCTAHFSSFASISHFIVLTFIKWDDLHKTHITMPSS